MVEIQEVGETEAAALRQRKAKAEDGAEDGAEESVDLTPDGSEELVKRIVKPGVGEVCGEGKRVSVHYTGRFLNGETFDSSVPRGRPLEFVVGRRNVILGWDIGIASMKKGEQARLTCRPNYAYGSSGAGGVIPPNATLEFDVELIDIKEDTGGSWASMFMFVMALVLAYAVFFMHANSRAAAQS